MPQSLIARKLLVKNTILNLVGSGLPLLVALFTIPLLIEGLGLDRFGALVLASVFIGYFSLFDMGVGRALTKLAAEFLGNGRHDDIPGLVWTAFALMGLLGVIFGLLVIFLTPWLVTVLLSVPESLQDETINAFQLLGAAIPIIMTTAGLRGLLEAYQRFATINLIKVPVGIFTYLGPLIVLYIEDSLVAVIGVMVAVRVIAWVAYVVLCFTGIKDLKGRPATFRKNMIRPILAFGGWITISNVVGPILLYSDRFLVGAMLSLDAVSYYATPYDIVTKLLIVPAAVIGVMFPAFSFLFAESREKTALLYKRCLGIVALVLIPFVFLIVVYANEGLTFWIDASFAAQSQRVVRWLAIGVFINSLGLVSQALVQASGRPDITAKLHMLELPLFLAYLPLLVAEYGIDGAAFAWVIRVSISTLFLSYFAAQRVRY
ncbi:MAG: O13/O129/O135 family O-antigen flippase [Gammaproteobacteria bacterium]|nr:MAG: O13/O129/O135 family O-antigen flippase [Gammaproteobacteria bacterium]